MRSLTCLVLVAACSSASPRTEPAPEPVAEAPPAAPSEEPAAAPELPTRCAELTRTDCMRSGECTLVLVEPEEVQAYACRPASGPCEDGLAQEGLEADSARCTERPGCAYEPAQCYCRCRGYGQTTVPDGDEAEDCDCECAGGLPPSCVASR